jgi:signal transduction histidine kinase
MWVTPTSQGLESLIDRHRSVLGAGPMWLVPLIREQQWLGGAVFGADSSTVGRLRGEGEAIEALSAAIALAILQAQSQGAAAAWSDELADANRRLAAMQPELLRTKTLETVVAMAAGAAHELNNPLAVISGRAQMLRNRATDEQWQRDLDAVVRHAQACSDIVTELMEFAQSATPSPETISLSEFLDAFRTQLISTGLLAAEALVLDVPSDTPSVQFDRDQLGRTFRELNKNAPPVEPSKPAAPGGAGTNAPVKPLAPLSK